MDTNELFDELSDELSALVDKYKIFDPNATTEGETYVVIPQNGNPEIVINDHVTLAHGTTLIFAGGKITGSGTLTGDYTRLVAPITQIFGKDITVDGIWEMDRAYPQWFGARNDISSAEFCLLREACEAAANQNKLDAESIKKDIETARNNALKQLDAWNVDSSDAINKAMKLKHAGEVFLPKGEYAICKTLQVPHGIVLRGELADYRNNTISQWKQDEESKIWEHNEIALIDGDYPLGGDTPSTNLLSYYKLGTVIRPLNTNYPLSVDSNGTPITSFDNNFAIIINPNIHPFIDHTPDASSEEHTDTRGDHNDAWEQGYPHSLTTIRDIQLSNYWTATPSMRGIYAIGGMKIENISWDQFVQAVATPNNMYCDGKTIINCEFNAPTGCIFKDFVFGKFVGSDEIIKHFVQDAKEYYAFDLGGLGDKLYFHRNHLPMGEIAGGLRLSYSFGAQISCNIINDNITFSDCKGISFSANHCESGIQVEISNSQIGFSDNYFHKGKKPTFLIHDNNARGSVNVQSSTVDLRNNCLVFMDHEDTDSILYIENISPYDIQTDGFVSLSIQNTYRYRLPRNAGGNIHPCGLAILKEIWTEGVAEPELIPFTEFNNLSYLLSGNSLLKPNFHIVHNHVVNNTQFLRGSAMANGGVKWFIDQGTYSYYMQTIWDRKRLIGSTAQVLGNFKLGEIDSESKLPTGFLLNFGAHWLDGPSDGNGNQAMIRLMRTRTSGNAIYHSVEVPVCGTRFLYDNGISVCGFKWQLDSQIDELPVNTMIQSIHFVGDNVVCKGTACPTVGEWTIGDIVYNTGTASNNALWIYTANGWQAR